MEIGTKWSEIRRRRRRVRKRERKWGFGFFERGQLRLHCEKIRKERQ